MIIQHTHRVKHISVIEKRSPVPREGRPIQLAIFSNLPPLNRAVYSGTIMSVGHVIEDATQDDLYVLTIRVDDQPYYQELLHYMQTDPEPQVGIRLMDGLIIIPASAVQ